MSGKTRNGWLVGADVRVVGRAGDADTGKTGTIVSVDLGVRKVGKTTVHTIGVHLRDGRKVAFLSTQLVLL